MTISTAVILCFLGIKVAAVFLIVYKKKLRRPISHIDKASTPPCPEQIKICIQLPVYNEPLHISELIQSVAKLEWPRENLEIQILDDSTDVTPSIIKNTLGELNQDLNIKHIQRKSRIGYKAGALENGVHLSDAEYFAIFDADFRPEPDFLIRGVHELIKKPDAAFVQAAWSYQNPEENLLTRCQNILLNIHFYIEHHGRHQKKLFFNFNGTAGIWKRNALLQTGGWSSESVCEDLLLSLRSDMNGYKSVFLDKMNCPSELPNSFSSFLIQQKRWALGSGQVLRMYFQKILRHKPWSLRKRIDALLHLSGYGFTSITTFAFILSPLWIWAFGKIEAESGQWNLLTGVTFFIWLLFSLVFLNLFSSKEAFSDQKKSKINRIKDAASLFFTAPYFLIFITPSFWKGLTHNKNIRLKTAFQRTPKNNSKKEETSLGLLVLLIFSIACFVYSIQQQLYLASALMLGHAWYGIKLFKLTKRKTTIKQVA